MNLSTLAGGLMAALPILTVLVLMVRFRWGAAEAGAMGWLIAQVVAAIAFGASPLLLVYAQLKGLLLTAYVLYIIWGALAFFRVTDEAGSIKRIGTWLRELTADRALHVLLLGWAFPSFLQGFGGYGVPVAVTAPLLVGLGFQPTSAVVLSSIGHSWSVSFGSLGASFYALTAATGYSAAALAATSALLLGPTCVLCAVACLWASTENVPGRRGARWQFVRSGIAPLLAMGLCMAVTQFVVAVTGFPSLASLVSGLVGTVVGVLLARSRPQGRGHGNGGIARAELPSYDSQERSKPPIGWDLAPYLLLVTIVLSVSLIQPLSDLLGRVVIRVTFPTLITSRGWTTPAETGRTIDVFGHPGALLVYTSLLSYWLLGGQGCYRPGAWRRIAHGVVKGAWRSSLGVAAMVGMAMAMEHAGMTHLLANGIARLAGQAFPLVAPFIGALGAFMTGSNTNSNVIFGSLQQRVAEMVRVSPAIVLSAQTAGAAIGSVFAPAKIVVACSTANLTGKEGQALGSTMRLGLAVISFVALLTILGTRMIPR